MQVSTVKKKADNTMMKDYETPSPVPYPNLQKNEMCKSESELHSLGELGRDPQLFDGSQHLRNERWLSLKVRKLVAAHKKVLDQQDDEQFPCISKCI